MVNTTNNLVDSFDNRVAIIPGPNGHKTKILVIEVSATLPIMTTMAGYVDKFNIREESSNNPSADISKIEDRDPIANPDRFIFINGVASPLNLSSVYLYYDKKYKDIIIIPSIEAINISLDNFFVMVRGYRLGSGRDFPDAKLMNLVGMDQVNRFDLPEAKPGATLKAKLITIAGFDQAHMLNVNKFEEQSGAYNLQHGDRRLYTCIELGTASDIFNGVTNIPLYLLYNASFTEHGVKYLGNTNPGNNKLYIFFRF